MERRPFIVRVRIIRKLRNTGGKEHFIVGKSTIRNKGKSILYSKEKDYNEGMEGEWILHK